MQRNYENYIGGQFTPDGVSRTIEVINPATEETIAEIPEADRSAVDAAIDAAERVQPEWASLPAIERAGYLRQISSKIRDNQDRLARLIMQEQGKVLPLAEVEVAFTADYIDYMAEWARRIEGEIINSDRRGESIFLFREPIGVTAGVLPWNFPFFLIARKMAPALVTGNTAVIKPSEETPLNAYEFARLVDETDLPKGVFNLVGGVGDTVGAYLSSHPKVGLVSFTGSVTTGKKIMAAAAPNLTRVNLELGGKAPAIVLADADLDLAARAIRDSRVLCTGQVCNAAERVYVQREVADAFAEKIVAAMAETRYGDPGKETDLNMGPLINKAAVERISAVVKRAVDAGGEVRLGGEVGDQAKGFHYKPTVLTGCTSEMDVMRQEVFGPVLPIQVVDSADEAVALANKSEYGLTSSVYTQNLQAAMHVVQTLKYGETYINRENFEAMQGFHAGRRHSGIGGADGKHGLYEYTETHVVYMQHG